VAEKGLSDAQNPKCNRILRHFYNVILPPFRKKGGLTLIPFCRKTTEHNGLLSKRCLIDLFNCYFINLFIKIHSFDRNEKFLNRPKKNSSKHSLKNNWLTITESFFHKWNFFLCFRMESDDDDFEEEETPRKMKAPKGYFFTWLKQNVIFTLNLHCTFI